MPVTKPYRKPFRFSDVLCDSIYIDVIITKSMHLRKIHPQHIPSILYTYSDMMLSTGACAVAAAGVLNDLTERHVTVKLKGGELSVLWDEADGKIYMTGPAVTVYDGIGTV